MNDAPLPPAGWYPDPEGGSGTRYWDGSAWTAHASPAPATPPSAPGYPATASPYPTYGETPAYGAPAAYGVQPAASSTTGFWVGGIVCGVVALLICPILFGPAGIALGAVAVRKGDQKGWIAVGVSIVGMIVGMAIGAALLLRN